MDRKIAGFSLFELLVSFAILSILMYVGISQYARYKAERELVRQANMLADEISWIRSQSIAKEPHGIKIDVKNYTIFKDDGDCQLTDNDTIVSRNNFLTGISADTLTVVFDRRGYCYNTSCGLGSSSITLRNDRGSTRLICISRYGRIRVETEKCPD
ncbi:MAG: pilus assembly FimT family protein [Thermodesulfovibrio sp.]|uniref:Prepilin-type N-terminal cleavage/methylation domain-containing protein n=1 Tax=Thermodesulfovibrio aggregans TaxID=86166 RepID=A0A2J6WN65_9BACT|nr:MAG: hypothetical protein C0186_02580 [Thermodesulfovibrio aggregans]